MTIPLRIAAVHPAAPPTSPFPRNRSAEWVPAPRYLATLTELACARSELPTADVAALGLARAAHLPLVTGIAELAGADPDVAVVVLARRGGSGI